MSVDCIALFNVLKIPNLFLLIAEGFQGVLSIKLYVKGTFLPSNVTHLFKYLHATEIYIKLRLVLDQTTRKIAIAKILNLLISYRSLPLLCNVRFYSGQFRSL